MVATAGWKLDDALAARGWLGEYNTQVGRRVKYKQTPENVLIPVGTTIIGVATCRSLNKLRRCEHKVCNRSMFFASDHDVPHVSKV